MLDSYFPVAFAAMSVGLSFTPLFFCTRCTFGSSAYKRHELSLLLNVASRHCWVASVLWSVVACSHSFPQCETSVSCCKDMYLGVGALKCVLFLPQPPTTIANPEPGCSSLVRKTVSAFVAELALVEAVLECAVHEPMFAFFSASVLPRTHVADAQRESAEHSEQH